MNILNEMSIKRKMALSPFFDPPIILINFLGSINKFALTVSRVRLQESKTSSITIVLS